MGEVQDIAQSTVFLLSEGATYISGVVLVVDGKIFFYFFELTYDSVTCISVRWCLVEPIIPCLS